MNKSKYLAIIGAVCVGLIPLARATVTDLGQVDLPNNGDATELQGFIDAGGDPDAVLCFKSVESGSTDFGGSIDISVNADNTLHVEWDMTGTGHLVCGFSTKDGLGNLVHYYSVAPDQGTTGEADLIVPGNGARALSHLDVFCCAGGVTTPDGGSTVALLGLAMTGLAGLRAKLGRN